MRKRIITAAIGILMMLPFLIFSHTWALVFMMSVLSVVAVGEILKCTGHLKRIIPTAMCMAVAVFAQVLAKVLSGEIYTSVMMLIYAAFFVLMLTSAVFSKGEYSISDASRSAVMTVYVTFGFSAFILLRSVKGSGLVLFLLAFFIPWVCDAMAYFVGMSMGKHKLIPDVSPKKTVEGAIGGTVGVVLLTAVFCVVMQLGFDKTPNYPLLLLLALVGGIIGQCGDLIASLLKREFGIKDYGKIFPGHGGVMDRFDSNIAVATFIYIVCRIFEGVNII